MGYLSEKCAAVRETLRLHPLDVAALEADAASMEPPRDLAEALRAARPAIIAEVKRASPSAGEIAHADAAALARRYAGAGASAISVLTDGAEFGGSLADLRAVRGAVSVPVLRKDFLVHPSQLLEARANGADAALLIAGCLSGEELRELLRAAQRLDLAALVETHSADDLEAAISAGAEVIGVNARDLETLAVDEERAMWLLAQVPSDRLAVYESGVSGPEQVRRAADAGATAVLVGEALMRARDPAAKLAELRSVAR